MDIHNLGDYQNRFLTIIDKAGTVRQFAPNFYQQQLNQIVSSRTKPIRILGLKCRQIGFSTWGTSFIYHRTATQYNKSGLVIADSAENSRGLFNMIKGFYQRSPDRIRPMRKYSNASEIVFNNPNESGIAGLNSQVLVTTAGNMSAGRSKTIQYLHCSEYAYWPNAGEVSTGLFQSVPVGINNTAIIIESTANGVSGKGAQFYELCMRAMDGDSAYSFVFFNWLDNPEYELSPIDGYKPTDEERELMTQFPALTARKLAFRRYKINNEMGTATLDPEDQFKQEYPLFPEQAFISSGRPVFKAELIQSLINKAKTFPGKKMSLSGNSFIEDNKGNFVFYAAPQRGMAYAIGADVAEGLLDGDASAACVMDKNLNVVATFYDRVDPDIFGKLLVKLARYYNDSLLTPEQNNHGGTVLNTIKNEGYYKIFRREVAEELGKDYQEKVGWNTNVKSKMLMLDDLVQGVRDGSINNPDEPTLREMMTLTIEDDGNIILNSKDRTVALGLARQGIKQASVAGQHQAIVPGKPVAKDVTKMTLQEKLNYYKRVRS